MFDHQDESTDLLSDLPRGWDAMSVGSPPHSYFEHPDNLAATPSLQFDAANNIASKLFLGVVNGSVVTEDRLPDGRLPRHVQGGTPIGVSDDRSHVLLAGSRAGKGRGAIIPTLTCLPNSTSVLCIDPKGDLARICARWRADGLGQKVGVLDPFGVSGGGTERFRVSFNPLGMLNAEHRDTFVPNAKLIADSIVVTGDFKEKHWDETAKMILAGIILHVMTCDRYEGMRNLVTVWHLISELAAADPDHPQRYWLETEMLANDSAGGMVRTAARQFYDRTGGEFSSVLSNLRKHTDWIGIECMQECLSGDSFDLRELKRGSLCIFSAIPAMRMGDLSGWNRLLVQLSLAAHEEEQQKQGASTVMLIDEFFSLGRLECLEVAAAQIAGLGAKIYAVLQDIGQLQNKYPKSWETFIANAGSLQIFGVNDQTTLEYISKRLGEAPTLTRSTNLPGFDQATKKAATGESWSLATHPLLTPEEIGRFLARDDKKLRQLILRPGYRPAILQRPFYDKHELFAGKYDDV